MDIIAEIAAYSLVDRHSGAILSIHPLVQSWCQNILADEPEVRECMMDILGMSVRWTGHDHLFRIGLIAHVDSLIQNPATVRPVLQARYARIYISLLTISLRLVWACGLVDKPTSPDKLQVRKLSK
jgi:hypothetical protein